MPTGAGTFRGIFANGATPAERGGTAVECEDPDVRPFVESVTLRYERMRTR